ncbi:MAG TPA: Mur ligase domain-containing protein [Candidatus Saccharimonadales bacterium]|nr:Mur ligase domain-containing protein [Candidatus Saccharimonadales bacterium]HSX27502.1 Mur ligase domain-containing protein [Patescibacteria group bacterium]
MHVYFSGVGGAAISALAVIAKEAGYEVSGSDGRDSQYLAYLRKQGIEDTHVGLTREQIAAVHARKPIDWFVYGSAQPLDFPDNPEFTFCKENNIKMTKRDELLNEILSQKELKLIAVAGTHGKTTTTAMVVWLFKQLKIPTSYSVGAKISFGDMGQFDPKSEYFVYEADEFDRNFLAFKPRLSIVSGVAWDHHEIFPTEKDYFDAFRLFVAQSQEVVLWHNDAEKLDLLSKSTPGLFIESENTTFIDDIKLIGRYNRFDGWLAIRAAAHLTQKPPNELIKLMNDFPGVSRRFEKLTENLYTDYAHTPDKIRGVMSVALETAQKTGQKIIIIYEPLTNRRMHYMKEQHQDVFDGVDALYWVPSYLAREDPNQPVLSPADLIKFLDTPAEAVARPAELNEKLKTIVKKHLKNGDLVIGLSGGGGKSLDEWLRQEFND